MLQKTSCSPSEFAFTLEDDVRVICTVLLNRANSLVNEYFSDLNTNEYHSTIDGSQQYL